MLRRLFALGAIAVAAAYEISGITPQMKYGADKLSSWLLNTRQNDVYDRIAYLADTYGPRFSGTPALEAALDQIVAWAQADGVTVTQEVVEVPKWVRGNEWARLESPRVKQLHMLGLGGSISTQGVLTAPVLVVSSRDDLTANCSNAAGKIVLFNVPFTTYGGTVGYRANAGVWAAACGAVGALVRSVASYSIQSPHTGGMSNATIPAAAVSVEDAAQMARMQARGQNVTVSMYMEASWQGTALSRNLLFDVIGTSKPNEYVVVGGHSDSWDITEGVMDDGASMLAGLEAVRAMVAQGLQPQRTIRAVAWVNEENGARGGAQYAVDYASIANTTSIIIESDSGPFTPWALGFTGHPAAKMQLQVLGELLAPIGAGNVSDGGGGTDIGPTCALGVPCGGLEVLDPRLSPLANNPCAGYSTYSSAGAPAYPSGYFFYHHSQGDDLEVVDRSQLNAVALAMATWAWSVAELPELLPRSGPVPPAPSPPGGGPGGSNAGPVAGGIIGGVVLAAAVFFASKRYMASRAAYGGAGSGASTFYGRVTGSSVRSQEELLGAAYAAAGPDGVTEA